MNRAYSVLEIKAVQDNGGKRTFSGIASTPTTDRMGDVVDPKGAQFKLPLPLLWQHDSRDPIGWVHTAKVTAKGIEIEGEVATLSADESESELGKRLLKAWQMLQSKLVRGLSIGFNSIESARIDNSYGLHFQKWEWLELSAVTIAANQEASITAIKSIDDSYLAALGRRGVAGDRNGPGASGQKQVAGGGHNSNRSQKGLTMKTLKDLREAREVKHARQRELVVLFEDTAHTKTDDELDEFDTLETEIKGLDTDIRIASFHERNAANAKGVDGSGSQPGSRSRSPNILTHVKDADEAFKGQNFTRMLIAKAVAMHEGESVVAIAQKRWGQKNPTLVNVIRAAVAGGGTGSGEWGSELAQADTKYNGDFIEFLYSKTVFDALPLKRVPARVHIKGQDGAATGYWVGESKAIPASAMDFSDVELTPLKVAALAVISMELMEDSDPAAEMLVRDGLVQASGQRVDTTFLSTAAAVAGVSPAGILNGVAAISTSGNDADGLREDIRALYAPFITAKNASGLVMVTTPSLAKAMSLMVNALGQTEFPGLTVNGGNLLGDQVFTGDNVGAGDLILLKPSDIWRIGDSGVRISMSREATIEQDNAPTGATDTPTAASATMTNMFQEESIAFKVVRRINFAKRRAGVVQYVGNADYGNVT